MKVLLSIKPEYAKLIFEGVKKFEYRRAIFKNKQVNTVIVYASSPIQKVIGEFEIEMILNENLDSLWKKTKKYAGIDKAFFYQYFDKKAQGFAIKIRSAKKYEKPLCIKQDLNLLPPQSFLYLDNSAPLYS